MESEQTKEVSENNLTIYLQTKERKIFSLPYQYFPESFIKKIKEKCTIRSSKLIVNCRDYSLATLELVCRIMVHEVGRQFVDSSEAILYPQEEVENYFIGTEEEKIQKAHSLLKALKFFEIKQDCYAAVLEKCKNITSYQEGYTYELDRNIIDVSNFSSDTLEVALSILNGESNRILLQKISHYIGQQKFGTLEHASEILKKTSSTVLNTLTRQPAPEIPHPLIQSRIALDRVRELIKMLQQLGAQESSLSTTLHICLNNETINTAIERQGLVYLQSYEEELLPIPYQCFSQDFKQRLKELNNNFDSDIMVIDCSNFLSFTLRLIRELVLHQAATQSVKNPDAIPSTLEAVPYVLDNLQGFLEKHNKKDTLAVVQRAKNLLRAVKFFDIHDDYFEAILEKCSKIIGCEKQELFYPHEKFYSALKRENLYSLPWERPLPMAHLFPDANGLDFQLNLSPQVRKNIAFDMLIEHAYKNPHITHPYIIDDTSRQELDIICGSDPKNRNLYFAQAIDCTSTEIGKTLLYSRLLQPTDTSGELQNRQSIIRMLIERPEIFNKLDKLFTDFFSNQEHENCILSFFDEKQDFFKRHVDQLIFPETKTKGLTEWLNSNPIALLVANSGRQITLAISDIATKCTDSVRKKVVKQAANIQDSLGSALERTQLRGNPEIKKTIQLNFEAKDLISESSMLTLIKDIVTLGKTDLTIRGKSYLIDKLKQKFPNNRLVDEIAYDRYEHTLANSIALGVATLSKNVLDKIPLINIASSLLPKLYIANAVRKVSIDILSSIKDGEQREIIEKKLETIQCLYKKLHILAHYIKFIKQVYEQVKDVPELESYLPSLKALKLEIEENQTVFSYFWNECDGSTNFDHFLDKLCNHFFTEKPKWLSMKFGRIISAYYLIRIHKERLLSTFMALAELDTYLSLARLFNRHKGTDHPYCFVSPIAGDPCIHLKNFWNPAIGAPKAVQNNIALGTLNTEKHPKDMIITGPNTGGKSTFIRALIYSVLMGQAFGICPAQEAQFTPFSNIRAYLNITDDPANGRSLFKVSADRANELLEAARKPYCIGPSLIIFDELFNGTNPEAGEALAYGTLKNINDVPKYPRNICIASTHFACVRKLREESDTDFAFFKVYDLEDAQNRYKLKPGIYRGLNAFDVAEEVGLSKKVIADSKNYHKENFKDKPLIGYLIYLQTLEESPEAFKLFINKLCQHDSSITTFFHDIMLSPYYQRLLTIAKKYNATQLLLNHQDSFGRTILHYAALRDIQDEQLIKCLIQNEALSLEDKKKMRPLDYAFQESIIKAHLKASLH